MPESFAIVDVIIQILDAATPEACAQPTQRKRRAREQRATFPSPLAAARMAQRLRLPVIITSESPPRPIFDSAPSNTVTSGFRASHLLRHPKHFVASHTLTTSEEYIQGIEETEEETVHPPREDYRQVSEFYAQVVKPKRSRQTSEEREVPMKRRKLEPKKEKIFCELCGENIAEESLSLHYRSVLHQFNLQNKPKPIYGLPPSNIGYQMMLKSGWQEERGLGAEEQGRLAPIKTRVKNDKLGLGIPPKHPLRVTHTPDEFADSKKQKARSRPKRKTLEAREREKELRIREYLYSDVQYC
jgi:hypothetical protein